MNPASEYANAGEMRPRGRKNARLVTIRGRIGATLEKKVSTPGEMAQRQWEMPMDLRHLSTNASTRAMATDFPPLVSPTTAFKVADFCFYYS